MEANSVGDDVTPLRAAEQLMHGNAKTHRYHSTLYHDTLVAVSAQALIDDLQRYSVRSGSSPTSRGRTRPTRAAVIAAGP